jgi:hypothetical protein
MSRIYMRVIVVNDSDATLRLRHSSTTGEWSPGGWDPAQFRSVRAGGSLWWQAEGESILGQDISGVEARAWYDVIAPDGSVIGEFHILANSPWIESQYGNTFHVRAPRRYYAAYVDANGQKKGNRAVLDISFRNSRKVAVPGFIPSVHGFQFANGGWSDALPVVSIGTLWNQLRTGLSAELADALGIPLMAEDTLPITHADAGLCGGMVYATMDYFNARQRPPPPLVTGTGYKVPPSSPDDPVFRHIRQRLLDSFDFLGKGHRWLSYTSPLYPDDDEGVLQSIGLAKGKSWVTYREEWPRIREQLDLGRLVPIGLVQSAEFDIGKNHQVLAYAYRQDGQTVQLWVYDPNIPEQSRNAAFFPDPRDVSPAGANDVYFEFDITDTANGITVHRVNQRPKDYEKRIYAIIHMDNYSPQTAPLGQPFPAPDRPKVVRLAIGDSESFTTEGTVEREEEDPCKNVLRFGHWKSRSNATFVAQISGFLQPEITWTVSGQPITPGSTQLGISVAGASFQVGCKLHANLHALTLSSAAGDTYRIPVQVTARDVSGETKQDQSEFEVEGFYDGMKIEDLSATTRCIASTIPVPADLGQWTIPSGPTPDPVAVEQWGQEAIASLESNPEISTGARDAIRGYVDLQVKVPEFRASGLNRVLQGIGRIRQG